MHSFAIGAYFSTRFVATGSLWEPIALHATNNICALLVRTDVAMKNPTVLFVVSSECLVVNNHDISVMVEHVCGSDSVARLLLLYELAWASSARCQKVAFQVD